MGDMRSTRLFSPFYATKKDEVCFMIETSKPILKPEITICPKRKSQGFRVPTCIVSRVDTEGMEWRGNFSCKHLPTGPVQFSMKYKSLQSTEVICSETTDGKRVNRGFDEIFKPEPKSSVNLTKGNNDLV